MPALTDSTTSENFEKMNQQIQFEVTEWPVAAVLRASHMAGKLSKHAYLASIQDMKNTRDFHRQVCCARCFQPMKTDLKCKGCHIVCYCGPECQKDDWILHKWECKVFHRAELMDKLSILRLPELRLLIRYVIAKDVVGADQKHSGTSIVEVEPKKDFEDDCEPSGDHLQKLDVVFRTWWKNVVPLGLDEKSKETAESKLNLPIRSFESMGSSNEPSEGNVPTGIMIDWQATRNNFRDVLQYTRIGDIDDETLFRRFLEVRQNLVQVVAYNEQEGGLSSRGMALYARLSHVPHSCDPDLSVTFPNGSPLAHIRTLAGKPWLRRKAVALPQSGIKFTVDHCSIAETQLLDFGALANQEERLFWLKWGRQIECSCRICKDVESAQMASGILKTPCTACKLGYLVYLPNQNLLKCSICFKDCGRLEDYAVAKQVVTGAKRVVDNQWRSLGSRDAIEDFMKMIEAPLRNLHPVENWHLLHIREDLFSNCISIITVEYPNMFTGDLKSLNTTLEPSMPLPGAAPVSAHVGNGDVDGNVAAPFNDDDDDDVSDESISDHEDDDEVPVNGVQVNGRLPDTSSGPVMTVAYALAKAAEQIEPIAESYDVMLHTETNPGIPRFFTQAAGVYYLKGEKEKAKNMLERSKRAWQVYMGDNVVRAFDTKENGECTERQAKTTEEMSPICSVTILLESLHL